MNVPLCQVTRDAKAWAEMRDTHMVVALAVHEIASASRPAHSIWLRPTVDEFERVGHIVVRTVDDGMFRPSLDGNYAWGEMTIRTAR